MLRRNGMDTAHRTVPSQKPDFLMRRIAGMWQQFNDEGTMEILSMESHRMTVKVSGCRHLPRIFVRLLTGWARVVTGACPPTLRLLDHPDLPWCEVVEVCPARIQLRRPEGWGYGETIDVEGRTVVRSP